MKHSWFGSATRPIARTARSGVMLIYCYLMLIVVLCLVSLAVDFGRAQLVKTELLGATDAAARQGACGLQTSVQTAIDQAVAVAADNLANGTPVQLDPAEDIEFGVWNPALRSFEPLSGSMRASATAVRVTSRRNSARGNPVPLAFGAFVGRSSVDVLSRATATRGRVIAPSIDARACPWLAGMPNGSSVARTWDNPRLSTAPTSSPTLMTGLPITVGGRLHFRQTSGSTGDTTSGMTYALDGNPNRIVTQAACNGIGATSAPIGALMGIFLDDRAPNTYAAATAGSFSTVVSRDFATLSPPLKQVFFIGDGLNSSNALQSFVVPTNATRLYLGIMDEKGYWWDNTGQIATSVLDSTIVLVE